MPKLKLTNAELASLVPLVTKSLKKAPHTQQLRYVIDRAVELLKRGKWREE